ncbi:SAM-dependent methyltransferase [Flavipsychrobacter stenotrophus]|uniref:SAM-dependent methyltransferase n=1 Tax=Flavipsychrobacter stenotrophus TaxID=2077091 RepID=A0A2S7SVR1_9BACT|nr:class I SAM-dependent methyltransferase [Flavipsychrobacter stenotrophus]PQJ10798.1 SAM-dependent methyltransferase [Flavipsychrobacter stenotrophus]
MSINKWDERYKEEQFAYGKEPNLFFKEWLGKYTPGAILMPAEGEGRNGVYAAEQGWQVTAFDQSVEGQAKALLLAEERGVSIEYVVGDLEVLDFDKERFDAIGLIYAHVDGDKKVAFHIKLDTCLRPGGVVIFEAFSKSHVQYNSADPKVGGPKDVEMLYSIDDITTGFGNYEVLLLEESEVVLNEGVYHNGKGAVVRFVGRKK